MSGPNYEVVSDGLGNLVPLRELRFWNCEKLENLPSRDVMLRLTKLRNLRISGCPQLEESCIKEWPKLPVVQHFPYSKN
uniref:Uncharacterized protein n=1 Tax=Solanum lycopersicum TaxID=4081 RepID=A0A3Q7IG46_SOLLC